ncbi:MAG: tyrosine-protein phosphatase [Clostridiaceae bacterium]|nr:tyrosine-protein phosphatase [Clostridiaceae bacterium]
MIVNLRELGGYRGQDGKQVKGNMLFRSGNLSFPDEELSKYLEPLTLSVVFDLRTADEAGREAYSLPDGIDYRHRPAVPSMDCEMQALNMAFPFPNQADEVGRATASLSIPAEHLAVLRGFLPRFYSDMGENPEIFGGIIREILENGEKAVLFHCSAGKDRTGILAALILSSLGVAWEDIRDNYLLSNHYRKEAIQREMQFLTRGISDPEIVPMIRDMLVVKEEYLEATFSHVRAYPHFDDYAKERMSLDSHDLLALRERYLE